MASRSWRIAHLFFKGFVVYARQGKFGWLHKPMVRGLSMSALEHSTKSRKQTFARRIGQHHGRALIVNDDPVVRDTLGAAIVKHGYGVVAAASGKEAGSMLKNDLFDLIFLDLKFLRQSISAFNVMYHIEITQTSLPLVIIMPSSIPDGVMKTLSTRVLEHLHKPIRLEELCAVAGRAMASRGGGDGLAGGPHRLDEPAGMDGLALTAREKEVLDLVAKGFHYVEAAELLDCRLSTIQTHVKHIYGKLKVHSCTEAIHEGQRLGFIG